MEPEEIEKEMAFLGQPSKKLKEYIAKKTKEITKKLKKEEEREKKIIQPTKPKPSIYDTTTIGIRPNATDGFSSATYNANTPGYNPNIKPGYSPDNPHNMSRYQILTDSWEYKITPISDKEFGDLSLPINVKKALKVINKVPEEEPLEELDVVDVMLEIIMREEK